jgi:hypothetical protein
MKAKFLPLLILFALSVLAADRLNAQIFKKKRHSVNAMMGLANNMTTPFTQSPDPRLKIDYLNGDPIAIPVSFRYQYRMDHGNRIGFDVMGNRNPLYLRPSFYHADFGFTGPSIALNSTMIGGNIHYSKAIDFKLLEIFGFLGFGAYAQFPDANNAYTQDYSWYKNAIPEFYPFAVAATQNALKSILPMSTIGFGARLKHLEAGLNYQVSIGSPVNDFVYENVVFTNNIRYRSLGYYVAYRIEF